MNIEKEVSLKKYNTFGINAQTDWLIHYDSIEALKTLVSDEYFQECRYLHIGEGSNLLFLANFHGIVLRSNIKTVEVLTEAEGSVELLVGSGVNWDDFVGQMTERGFYGLEALSLIPGQVGAAAIQNIGAYGTEVKEYIKAVHTIHRRSGKERIFSNEECQYAYRYSIFKDTEYSDYIVTHVHFQLSKLADVRLNYKDLQNYFADAKEAPTPVCLRQAVIEIRNNKLPSVAEIGNAGSFFMNPIVSKEVADKLLSDYPNAPHYLLEDGRVKLAAAWLIDQCGFKGAKRGNAGVYERQALVLVNLGEATGQDIANLAIEIQESVKTKFGVDLNPEVKYIS